ncbi:MAG: hypothetical protein ACPG8I_07635, partial [Candidatus Poseidoniaceae archaeon]
MAEEHSARVASIEAKLQSVRMEIDDDDEDVLDIEVVLVNEAAVPLGGLDVRVVTSEGKEVGPLVPISSLGPGAQRSLRFHLHLDHGEWSFTANTMSGVVELGPFACDMEFEAQKGRKLANAMGSSLFSGAFEEQLDEFGQVAERGLIDASSVQMTQFSAENAQGGATTIRSAGTFGHAEEEGPKTPPWAGGGTPPAPASAPAASAVDPLLAPVVAAPAPPTPEPEAPAADPLLSPITPTPKATVTAAEPPPTPAPVDVAPTP